MQILRYNNIPSDVKFLTWAESIRYFGWGFSEFILAIFIFSVVGDYAKVGIISSIFEIVFIISLPFVGMWTDRVPVKKILMTGLAIYPFIGLSYFLAGEYSLVIFIIFAKAVNGFSFALDSVGSDVYLRRRSDSKNASTIFGYFETVGNFWWIMPMIASLWLLEFVEMHYLFLIIIPTTFITLFLVSKLNSPRPVKRSKKFFSLVNFRQTFNEVRAWDRSLKVVLLVFFLLSIISVVVEFIFPISAYSEGKSIQYAVLINICFLIPTLFGFFIGKFLDKNRRLGIGLGIIFIFFFLALQFFVDLMVLKLLIFFALGIAFEMVTLGCDGLATLKGDLRQYGVMSGIIADISSIGKILGMIFLGFFVEKWGFDMGMMLTLGVAIALFLVFVFNLKYLGIETPLKYRRGVK